MYIYTQITSSILIYSCNWTTNYYCTSIIPLGHPARAVSSTITGLFPPSLRTKVEKFSWRKYRWKIFRNHGNEWKWWNTPYSWCGMIWFHHVLSSMGSDQNKESGFWDLSWSCPLIRNKINEMEIDARDPPAQKRKKTRMLPAYLQESTKGWQHLSKRCGFNWQTVRTC